MTLRYEFQTGQGQRISATAHATYTTRKRAAKKAKAAGHTSLYQLDRTTGTKVELSHYIQ